MIHSFTWNAFTCQNLIPSVLILLFHVPNAKVILKKKNPEIKNIIGIKLENRKYSLLNFLY